MKTYEFYWSPEGRKLTEIKAQSLAQAKAQFKRDFPEHAKYMGEVYWIEIED